MDQFFGNLYCPLFEEFFGLELANYMWGLSSPEQQTVMFIGVGLWMIGISLSMAVLYYYVINHPRLCMNCTPKVRQKTFGVFYV